MTGNAQAYILVQEGLKQLFGAAGIQALVPLYPLVPQGFKNPMVCLFRQGMEDSEALELQDIAAILQEQQHSE